MNQKRYPLILLSLVLAGSSVMCSFFTALNPAKVADEQKIATVISLQKTEAENETVVIPPTAIPAVPKATPTIIKPLTGSISGKLSYPSESIPPLRIVAIKPDTGEFFSTENNDQNKYRLDGLPVGKYHVMAYLVDQMGLDPNLAGGYSKFVPCGLQVSCSDHTLLDVDVTAGAVVSDIDPADWYAPPGTFPADPTK